MSTAKEEVKVLLDKLPDDCSLEDVQYHLYVVKKIHRGSNVPRRKGRLARMRSKGNSVNGPRNKVVARGNRGSGSHCRIYSAGF